MPGELDLFRQETPKSFMEGALRAVFEGCREAHNLAKRYDPARQVDAVPALRRLEVEERLNTLLIDSSTTVRRLVRTQSSTHAQFTFGRVVLTALTRSEAVHWVEPYPYRKTLARLNQISLFATEAENGTPRDLYALLIYGGPLLAPLPQLARIVFPLPSGFFLPDYINLFTECAAVAAQYIPSAAPALEPEVKLKPVAKQKPEEGDGS